MSLCFGGGQIGLGLAGFVLGFVTLTGLKKNQMVAAVVTPTANSPRLASAALATFLFNFFFLVIKR
jgi:hypothetical protein